jgi:hypothetical protein
MKQQKPTMKQQKPLLIALFLAALPTTLHAAADEPAPAKSAAARLASNENVILENQGLRMVFERKQGGYASAIVSVHDGKQWRRMAVSRPIGHVAYRTADGRTVETDIAPARCEILKSEGPVAEVRFAAQRVDEDGAAWNFAYSFQIEAGKHAVKTRYEARADKDRQLLHFQGPNLLAGDGSFGANKSLAIFPGLEYLEGRECSSSGRDNGPCFSNRYAPHPYNITIPLMAVEADNCLVGLMWDVLQKWDGERVTLSARFASPNFHDRQNNHLMGLFLPSIPEFVPGNSDRAAKAYPLGANKKIAMESYIVAEAGGKLLNMIDHYLAVFGLPKKLDLPITYDEALELGRVGYMETLYDPKVPGIKLWEPSPAYPAPGACAILWRLSLDSKDPARKKMIRDRVGLLVNKALEREGAKGLTDWLDGRDIPFDKKFPASCGVRSHLLPFYIGHVEDGLAAWKKRVYEELLDKQRPDGSWEYLGDMREMIRQGDDIVDGTMTELTGGVLMYARITGDQRALDAGLKAVKYMERFVVPRGMNTWEVPKHAPDVQAAGLHVWCCLEAYQITGEKKYLDQAKYWAKTGVPFVYFWKAPDRPVMKFSTIACLGTSWMDGIPWIGQPVQWCGLPYGYWILKLSEYDQSLPWRAIAEGIMDSGIEQMLMIADKRKGLYADALKIAGEGKQGGVAGPAWEPELIMKCIFLMRGLGVEVNSKVLHAEGKRIHVSTGAVLKSAQWADQNRGIAFELQYPAGETSYATVAGVAAGGTGIGGDGNSPGQRGRASAVRAVDGGAASAGRPGGVWADSAGVVLG